MIPRTAMCCTALISVFAPWAISQTPDPPALRSVTVMTIRYLAAFKRRDINSMGREMTKDFSWRRLDGETVRGGEALTQMKQVMDRAAASGPYSLAFNNVRAESNDVAIDGRATLERTVKNEDGSYSKGSVTTISKYLWTRTIKGWRIRRIDDLRQEMRPASAGQREAPPRTTR